MAQSYPIDTIPKGYSISKFIYKGIAAEEQCSFGAQIGICDMVQFDLNSDDETTEYFQGGACAYYHAGIVQHSSDKTWWVYLEWGRINNTSYSWEGEKFLLSDTGNFIFRLCDSQQDAHKYFRKKCEEKNKKRITQKEIGGIDIWVPSGEKRGYIVQKLATRMRGLPDAYTKVTIQTQSVRSSKDPTTKFAQDMSGGSIQYAQTLIENGGAIPTLDSIEYMRTELIPAAMRIINTITPPKKTPLTPKQIANAIKKQLNNNDLINLSEYAATFIPRPVPLHLSKKERKEIVVLSQDRIQDLQNDLDIFETLLQNPTTARTSSIDIEETFGAEIEWLDPSTPLWKWLEKSLSQMTNNRHFRKGMAIQNIFTVRRKTWDEEFLDSVKKVAKLRKGKFSSHATLQPNSRIDMEEYDGKDIDANVYLGIHGTRAVNVLPIVKNNLRLPQHIKGVHMTGVDFGYGIYFATDWKKSYGYVGANDSLYVKPGSEGRIEGRHLFLLLSDVIMGKPYLATGTGSWLTPPKGFDSIAMFPENIASLNNDEYTIFDPTYQRIRYIIEFCKEK